MKGFSGPSEQVTGSQRHARSALERAGTKLRFDSPRMGANGRLSSFMGAPLWPYGGQTEQERRRLAEILRRTRTLLPTRTPIPGRVLLTHETAPPQPISWSSFGSDMLPYDLMNCVGVYIYSVYTSTYFRTSLVIWRFAGCGWTRCFSGETTKCEFAFVRVTKMRKDGVREKLSRQLSVSKTMCQAFFVFFFFLLLLVLP